MDSRQKAHCSWNRRVTLLCSWVALLLATHIVTGLSCTDEVHTCTNDTPMCIDNSTSGHACLCVVEGSSRCTGSPCSNYTYHCYTCSRENDSSVTCECVLKTDSKYDNCSQPAESSLLIPVIAGVLGCGVTVFCSIYICCIGCRSRPAREQAAAPISLLNYEVPKPTNIPLYTLPGHYSPLLAERGMYTEITEVPDNNSNKVDAIKNRPLPPPPSGSSIDPIQRSAQTDTAATDADHSYDSYLCPVNDAEHVQSSAGEKNVTAIVTKKASDNKTLMVQLELKSDIFI